MNDREHWDQIYRTRGPAETSWHTPHADRSLAMIHSAAPDRSAAIIDVGGGRSTLVDHLLADGYRDITVLDISELAMDESRRRLGADAREIHWLPGDITSMKLEPQRYDVWHDRAAFHFLVEPEQRRGYVDQLLRAMKPNGHVVIATFGPQGPERCTGLATCRYDADALQAELAPHVQLIESAIESHRTPLGTEQQFLYCHFALK
jgi:SAM-dependent methyltransferase